VKNRPAEASEAGMQLVVSRAVFSSNMHSAALRFEQTAYLRGASCLERAKRKTAPSLCNKHRKVVEQCLYFKLLSFWSSLEYFCGW
jgi:hypothetical protein